MSGKNGTGNTGLIEKVGKNSTFLILRWGFWDCGFGVWVWV